MIDDRSVMRLCESGWVRVGVLGPLEVRAGDGSPVEVRGGRLRALLVRLALDAGRPVGTTTLVDALWGDEPPAAVANALQSLVSRLRTTLGSPDAVRSGPAGYTLTGARVDALEFERLVSDARAATDPDKTVDLLTEAEQLWRGEALADVRDVPFADAPAARLDDLRLAAAEDRAAALVRLGRAGDAVAVLRPLAAAHPLRERTHELLIRTLHASGRQTDAVTTYDDLRTRLADELGVDPSPRLRDLHVAVLRGHDVDPVRRPTDTKTPDNAMPKTAVPDNAVPNNLRARLTSFVGRSGDVEAIGHLLGTARLLTLVGPGGAGKTRLATETAPTLAPYSPDGIWFVELAPLADPADVAPAILSALGVSEYVDGIRGTIAPGRIPAVRAARDRLLEVLAERRVTLLLDNCEHLVAGVADLADALLTRCPSLRVLATSREPLGIDGEQLYPVGPLELPARDESTGAAVQLFADRATAVSPGFTLTAQNGPAVGEICRRLDGMPLAIELAAARLRSMSPEQIVARLSDRFRLLTSGSRTALPRHQTLRAVVEWSWDLLDDAERAVARRLSVFAGGATLEAAERVCAGDGVPADDVLPVLASLVDKSLLEATDSGGSVRYRMLETVKAFSAERLAEAGETDAVRRTHAEHFRELVELAEPKLRTGEQLVWIARLDADHDNLLGALRLAIDTGDADLAIRLVAVLGEYWNLRGRPAESMTWLRSALDVPGQAPVRQRSVTLFLYALGNIATEGTERTDLAMRRSLRALAEIRLLHRRHRREDGWMEALIADGIWAMIRRDRSAALVQIEKAQDDPDPWNRSLTRMMRAMLAENEGDVEQMYADLTEALAGFRSLGDRWGMSLAQRGLASHAMQAGDHARAVPALTEALRLLDELGTREGVPMLLVQRSQSRAELGDTDGARADLLQAREQAIRDASPGNEAFANAALGVLERRAGDLDSARELTDRALDQLGAVSERFAPQALAMMHAMRAAVALDDGDLDLAGRLCRRAVELGAAAEDMPVLSAVVEASAAVELAAGDAQRSARLLGVAAALRGMRSLPGQDVRRTAEQAREALGDTAYQAEYDGGASLTRAAAYTELDLPADPFALQISGH